MLLEQFLENSLKTKNISSVLINNILNTIRENQSCNKYDNDTFCLLEILKLPQFDFKKDLLKQWITDTLLFEINEQCLESLALDLLKNYNPKNKLGIVVTVEDNALLLVKLLKYYYKRENFTEDELGLLSDFLSYFSIHNLPKILISDDLRPDISYNKYLKELSGNNIDFNYILEYNQSYIKIYNRALQYISSSKSINYNQLKTLTILYAFSLFLVGEENTKNAIYTFLQSTKSELINIFNDLFDLRKIQVYNLQKNSISKEKINSILNTIQEYNFVSEISENRPMSETIPKKELLKYFTKYIYLITNYFDEQKVGISNSKPIFSKLNNYFSNYISYGLSVSDGKIKNLEINNQKELIKELLEDGNKEKFYETEDLYKVLDSLNLHSEKFLIAYYFKPGSGDGKNVNPWTIWNRRKLYHWKRQFSTLLNESDNRNEVSIEYFTRKGINKPQTSGEMSKNISNEEIDNYYHDLTNKNLEIKDETGESDNEKNDLELIYENRKSNNGSLKRFISWIYYNYVEPPVIRQNTKFEINKMVLIFLKNIFDENSILSYLFITKQDLKRLFENAEKDLMYGTDEFREKSIVNFKDYILDSEPRFRAKKIVLSRIIDDFYFKQIYELVNKYSEIKKIKEIDLNLYCLDKRHKKPVIREVLEVMLKSAYSDSEIEGSVGTLIEPVIDYLFKKSAFNVINTVLEKHSKILNERLSGLLSELSKVKTLSDEIDISEDDLNKKLKDLSEEIRLVADRINNLPKLAQKIFISCLDNKSKENYLKHSPYNIELDNTQINTFIESLERFDNEFCFYYIWNSFSKNDYFKFNNRVKSISKFKTINKSLISSQDDNLLQINNIFNNFVFYIGLIDEDNFNSYTRQSNFQEFMVIKDN